MVRRTVPPFVVESRPCGHTPLSGEEKFDVARLHAYALLLCAKSRSDARGVVRAGRVIAQPTRNLVSHPSAACMRMQWELAAAARRAAARVGVGDHGRVTLTTYLLALGAVLGLCLLAMRFAIQPTRPYVAASVDRDATGMFELAGTRALAARGASELAAGCELLRPCRCRRRRRRRGRRRRPRCPGVG